MTPQEVLAYAKGLGYRLALRPGGMWLAPITEPSPDPPPDLLGLIAEHRDGLIAYLEEYERQYAIHAESLAKGRIVPFQAHLLPYVHPSIRHLVEVQEPPQKARNGHLNALSIQHT